MHFPPDTIIACGPIIIENDKVLLNREKKRDGTISPYFMLPGGTFESTDSSFEEVCIREAKEELGMDINILRPLKTMLVKRPGQEEKMAILIHYLAARTSEIVPGPDTVEWDWYDIHNLPENTAPNIKEAIESYLAEPNIL